MVTVFANMAASSSCRSEILSVGGVAFLLGLMEECSRMGSAPDAEVAAAERVMKKAAIALSR